MVKDRRDTGRCGGSKKLVYTASQINKGFPDITLLRKKLYDRSDWLLVYSIKKIGQLKEAIEYKPDMLFTMTESDESSEVAIACSGKINVAIKV